MDVIKLSEITGSKEQLAYARRAVLTEGKSDGMKVIEAANAAGLSMTIFENRCLDIARLSYKGINMGFICKAGWVSPQNYSSVENNFNEYFHGGMLYTCGLENFGPESMKNERVLPVHGTIGMTPAEEGKLQHGLGQGRNQNKGCYAQICSLWQKHNAGKKYYSFDF